MSINISDKFILDAIKEYSKNPDVAAEIQSRLGKGRKFVPKYVEPNQVQLKDVQRIAYDMAKILYAHITTETSSKYGRGLYRFNRKGIKVGALMYNKGYEITIDFDPRALHRDSLVPQKYDGVDDIIRLFMNGYKTNKQVYGTWKTHGNLRVRSLTHREGSRAFFDNAIKEFNDKYKGKAHAYPTENYK